MPIPSPGALSPTPNAINAQQLRHGTNQAEAGPWKLNQLLTAQVIKLTAGETALRINGQLFTPVSSLPLTPGETRQLRVASLDPVIKLTLVDVGSQKDIPLRLLGPTISAMNSSRWAATVAAGPYKLATLLSVFKNPPQVMQQNLSPQVQASLGAIAALLPSTDDLRSVARLKTALASVSLKSAGQSDNSELGRMLQTLHQQLSKQVQEQQTNPRSSWPVDSYKGEQDMRTSVSTTLLRLLEEASKAKVTRGHRQAGLPYLPLTHWRWEFPLLERNRDRLFSMSAWLRQSRRRKTGIDATIWSLRCACELANYGLLAIVMRLKDREIRVHLHCEYEDKLGDLRDLEARLKSELSEFGISLKRFSCAAGNLAQQKKQVNQVEPISSAAHDFDQQTCLSESMHERLQHAAITGVLPVLEDFTLEDAAGTDHSQQKLPDPVYQALASLFNAMLEEQEV